MSALHAPRSEPRLVACPRCGLVLRVVHAALAPRHCPRCLARSRVAVRLEARAGHAALLSERDR